MMCGHVFSGQSSRLQPLGKKPADPVNGDFTPQLVRVVQLYRVLPINLPGQYERAVTSIIQRGNEPLNGISQDSRPPLMLNASAPRGGA